MRKLIRFVVLAIALSVAAGAVIWIQWRANQPPLALLARAYSKQRSIELRVSGEDYSPPIAERGIRHQRTAELMEAELLIQRRLEGQTEINAGTAGWLHAEGRAATLEGNYEDAIAKLELARDLGSGASEADVLTDLATAYFERGLATSEADVKTDQPTAYFEPGRATPRAIDFSMSMELLSRARLLSPASPIACYNLAMVFQRAYYYPNAAEEWRRYLSMDSAGPWADEARRQLAFAEERIQAPDPAAKKTDDLIEIQSDQAVKLALTPDGAPEIASRLRNEHQDRWFTAALPFRDTAAARVLAGMTATREALRMDRFDAELSQLRSLSPRIDSEALRVWLQFEELFRITHSPDVAGCMASLNDLIETCRRREYAWFLTQTLLERATCEVARGDFAAAEATDRDALDIARQHSLPVAGLRAAGLLTGYLAAAGQYRDAAELQHDALGFFWSRPMPYARGQELFHDMVIANEGLSRFHVAKASAESAALLAQRGGVAMNEAVNRARMAGFSERLGLKHEAAEQYTLATRLFDGMAESPAVEEYRAFAEAFAALAGDGSSLARFEPIVKKSTNPFVVTSYLHTAAILAERAHRITEARQRLEEAIAVIEKSPAPARNTKSVLEWRDQLQSCYRDLTRIALLQNDISGAYRIWQDFLRADEALEGYRAIASDSDGLPATVVTFAKLGDRYGVWVRSDDRLRFDWVSQDAATIDRLVRNYSALCSQPRTRWEFAERAGKPLLTGLLGFALQAVPESRVLLIQPDLELARLPWASLALPSGEPLGERFQLAVLPTSVASSGPIRVPEIRIRHALIVGATSVHPSRRGEFLPLPGIEEEIAAVQKAFPSAEVLEGGAASSARISRAMEDADALHFAGHALLANGRVQLLVAPDASSAEGLWRPGGTRRGHLNLAVLSACSTARYRDPEDPRPENLASALLFDGASQVIATLWDADSSATSYFMQSFYRNLRLNHTPMMAIAEASADTRRQAAWANPYYWASFSLFLRS